MHLLFCLLLLLLAAPVLAQSSDPRIRIDIRLPGVTLTQAALSPNGDLLVAGTIATPTFPVPPGAAQPVFGGGPDLVIARINRQDGRIVAATYLGGPGAESFGVDAGSDPVECLSVDRTGNVYVLFRSDYSSALPMSPFRESGLYLAKLDPGLTRILYGVHLPGPVAHGLAVGPDGMAYASVYSGYEGAALVKVSPTGSSSSTPLSALATAIAVDANGGVAVADGNRISRLNRDGTAVESTLALPAWVIAFDGAGNLYAAGADIDRISPAGDRVRIGSLPRTWPEGIVADRLAIDAQGRIAVFGRTRAAQLATTPGALFPCNPAPFAYHLGRLLLRYSEGGSALIESTFLEPDSVSVRASDTELWSVRGENVRLYDPTRRTPLQLACAVNSASFEPVLAPGMLVTILGTGIGPSPPAFAQWDASGRGVTTNLAGVSVRISGVAAPLLYAGGDQINAVVPYFTQPGSASITVYRDGVRGGTITVPVRRDALGIFRNGTTDFALALNQDGTINTVQNPARKGSVVTLWATGAGILSPGGGDGEISRAPLGQPVAPIRMARPADPVTGTPDYVNLGMELLYAGSAPGMVSGMIQINLRAPVAFPSWFVASPMVRTENPSAVRLTVPLYISVPDLLGPYSFAGQAVIVVEK